PDQQGPLGRVFEENAVAPVSYPTPRPPIDCLREIRVPASTFGSLCYARAVGSGLLVLHYVSKLLHPSGFDGIMPKHWPQPPSAAAPRPRRRYLSATASDSPKPPQDEESSQCGDPGHAQTVGSIPLMGRIPSALFGRHRTRRRQRLAERREQLSDRRS